MGITRRTFGPALLVAATLAACSARSEEPAGSAEGAAVPVAPRTWFEQAAVCQGILNEHASVRSADIEEGTIRWRCGDVSAVTDGDLGQEFCEYRAVQGGRVIRSADALSGGPLSCVFTSVFTETNSVAPLRDAMADPANLGVTAVDPDVVRMRRGGNARAALAARLDDCARSDANADRLRRSACYEAWVEGGETDGRLVELCARAPLSEQAWIEAQAHGAKIRAAGEPGYEAQRDLAGCLKSVRAGTGWQQSDTLLCSRVDRAAQECGCKLDDPPSSIGVPFTGWTGDALPSGCRRAVVDGAPYPYITICDVSAADVATLATTPSYRRDLGNFCHDRFSLDLLLKLPVRSLQQPGTCASTPGFCATYMHGGTTAPE